MDILSAIVLGVVQGLTEFLPVSSSGHLVIFHEIFGMNDLEESHLLFDTMLHVGTIVSILLVYRKDIVELIIAFFEMILDAFKGKFDVKTSPEKRMVWLLIIGTIPAVIIGLIFKDIFEMMFKSIRLVGFTLLFTGFLLLLTNRIAKGSKNEKTTSYSNALFIGLFQSLAIIPGISRSGSTIVGGLLNGLKKEFAIKFSFLMSIPAILGAAVLQIPDISKRSFDSASIFPYIIGTIMAAVVGFFAIKFLIKLLEKGKFYIFSYYCWTVGLISIIYSFLFR